VNFIDEILIFISKKFFPTGGLMIYAWKYRKSIMRISTDTVQDNVELI